MVQAEVGKKKKRVGRPPDRRYGADKLRSFTIRLPSALYLGVRNYCHEQMLSLQDVAVRSFGSFLEAKPAATVRAHEFADLSAAERVALRNVLDLLRAGPEFAQSRHLLEAVADNWRRFRE